jgi:hypothetical protein
MASIVFGLGEKKLSFVLPLNPLCLAKALIILE